MNGTRIHSGHGFVLLAAALFGTTGTAQAFAPQGLSPAFIGALRLAVGGPALLILAVACGRMKGLGSLIRSPAALAAVAGTVLFQLCFFQAVARTGVAVGTLVAIGSTPIAAGVIEFAVTRNAPSRRWFVSTAVAIVGCACLLVPDQQRSVDPSGVLLSLAAGTGYAVCMAAVQRMVSQQAAEAVMAVVLTAGAVALLPVLATGNPAVLIGLRGGLVALWLGLFATAAAYLFLAKGLARIPVAHAGTLALGEPMVAALLGIFLLKEPLTALAWAGVLLIFLALVIISIGERAPSSCAPTRRRGLDPAPAGRAERKS